MDAETGTEQPHQKRSYTTTKQVQAWFLGRSRDRWKNKARHNHAELKRLRQRVADVEASRAHWRQTAETARQEIERLQAQTAHLQARLDQQAEDAAKKKGPTSPA